MERKNFEQRLVDRLYDRIHKRNKNALIGIYGPPGAGKSYTALRIAELMDPDFSADHVVFSVNDFNRLINAGLPRGTAIVGDDFGVAANARKWQSDPNIILSFIAQSFRWMGYCTIITLPDIDGLDAQVRRLFHLSLQTIRIDDGHQVVICEPRVPRRYMTSKTTYWYYPTTRKADADYPPGTVIKRVAFHHPAENLCNAYETKRKAVMTGLYQQWERQGAGPGRHGKPWPDRAVLWLYNEVQSERAVAEVMGISPAAAHQIIARARQSQPDFVPPPRRAPTHKRSA